jgi:hypothetical protein
MKHSIITLICLTTIFCACSPIAPEPTPLPATAMPAPTKTPLPPPTATPEPTETTAEMEGMIPILNNWREVPVMPEATSGMFELGDYFYTINSDLEEITTFYTQAMSDLGWQPREEMTKLVPGTAFTYYKDGIFVFFMIESNDDQQTVFMHFVEE